MMPVMSYIHEKENYPLSLHIYPANENQEASFELYEDDGESLDYQKDIYATTKFTCFTNPANYEVKISARQTKGYEVVNGRNIIIKIYTDRKPTSVVKGKAKLPFISLANFLKNSGNKISDLSWSWDEKTGVCLVKVADDGKEAILCVIK